MNYGLNEKLAKKMIGKGIVLAVFMGLFALVWLYMDAKEKGED